MTQPAARAGGARPVGSGRGAEPTAAVRLGAGLPGTSAAGSPRASKPRRLKVAVPIWLRVRSLWLLGLISVVIGLLVAAVLATAIGLAVQALTHAVGNGP